MTDNEILIEVAKLDGFDYNLLSETLSKIEDGHRVWHDVSDAPYLTSRDAIIPVIENLDLTIEFEGEFKSQITKILCDFYKCSASALSSLDVLTATPRQLCIALLKATGKWKD